jgi:hypothetical protein
VHPVYSHRNRNARPVRLTRYGHRMVTAYGGDIPTDPRGINLHGIPHKVQAGEAAWDFLSGFRYHQRTMPGLPGVLKDLQVLQDTIEDVRTEIVRDMRADGCTWGEIGDALGMSRQGARQRYGGIGVA